jgi:hypothetical protein
LESLFELLKESQDSDQNYRKFMAGLSTDAETPSKADIVDIGNRAVSKLRSANLGITNLPAENASFETLINFAEQSCLRRTAKDRYSMSWLKDLFGNARTHKPGQVSSQNKKTWRAYAALYAAANYGAGIQAFDEAPSETIDLLREGTLSWKDVRPRPCCDSSAYDIHYLYDDHLRRGIDPAKTIPGPQATGYENHKLATHSPLPMRGANGHHGRLQFVTGHIKYLAAILLDERGPDEPFRWLDMQQLPSCFLRRLRTGLLVTGLVMKLAVQQTVLVIFRY